MDAVAVCTCSGWVQDLLNAKKKDAAFGRGVFPEENGSCR